MKTKSGCKSCAWYAEISKKYDIYIQKLCVIDPMEVDISNRAEHVCHRYQEPNKPKK